jgi:hypothetical protein
MFRAALAALLLALPAAQDPKTRILFIGKARDHAATTHEYMADCELLATCVRQTPGVEAVVTDGWPKDPAILKDVKCIVLDTQFGGDVLFKGPQKDAALDLFKKGAGLVAIHWATGAAEGEPGELQLKTLGGWFNVKFSQYHVRESVLKRAAPDHPISRGWEDFKLREEYYIKLKHLPEAKPIMTAEVNGEVYTIGWAYERPDGGRSFGTVEGHFHDNFANDSFRRGIVNGILWAAKLEVPKDGAPCAITPKDMELPPDTRKK